MGWFLNGDKKKTAARSRRTKALGRSPWDPVKTLAALQMMGALGLLLGVAVSWNKLESWMTDYAVINQSVPAELNKRVALINTPNWMNPTLKEQLTHLAAGQVTSDPMDPASLQRLFEAMSASPWVERVERVQRTSSGPIEVTAEFRQPTALVEMPEGYHLIDSKGVRLPVVYPRHAISRLNLPVITGVASKPRPEGQPWPGEDLQAGLALVKMLADQPYTRQIQAYDVRERDPRGRIRLVLKTRTGMVRWGLPPGQEQPVEPDASIKKQWLAKVAENYRGLVDAGGKVVDVYGAAVFVHPTGDSEAEQAAGYTWSR